MPGDRIFNFNGANVTFNDIHDNTDCTINTNGAKDISEQVENPSATPSPEPSFGQELAAGDLFKYIHPSITDDAKKTQITLEIQNLVRTQPLPDICHYLIDMKKANRIYLNVKPEAAFAELHRMGMPDETHDGFAYKTFTKYYNVN